MLGSSEDGVVGGEAFSEDEDLGGHHSLRRGVDRQTDGIHFLFQGSGLCRSILSLSDLYCVQVGDRILELNDGPFDAAHSLGQSIRRARALVCERRRDGREGMRDDGGSRSWTERDEGWVTVVRDGNVVGSHSIDRRRSAIKEVERYMRDDVELCSSCPCGAQDVVDGLRVLGRWAGTDNQLECVPPSIQFIGNEVAKEHCGRWRLRLGCRARVH